MVLLWCVDVVVVLGFVLWYCGIKETVVLLWCVLVVW